MVSGEQAANNPIDGLALILDYSSGSDQEHKLIMSQELWG
jgi:hypothetical protein